MTLTKFHSLHAILLLLVFPAFSARGEGREHTTSNEFALEVEFLLFLEDFVDTDDETFALMVHHGKNDIENKSRFEKSEANESSLTDQQRQSHSSENNSEEKSL